VYTGMLNATRFVEFLKGASIYSQFVEF
jgi:hypothetical protein